MSAAKRTIEPTSTQGSVKDSTTPHASTGYPVGSAEPLYDEPCGVPCVGSHRDEYRQRHPIATLGAGEFRRGQGDRGRQPEADREAQAGGLPTAQPASRKGERDRLRVIEAGREKRLARIFHE
jgi:hypothetical protein